MIRISFGEVFLAAAGAFLSIKMTVPGFYDVYQAWSGLPAAAGALFPAEVTRTSCVNCKLNQN